MDYPNQRRSKILARARIKDAAETLELISKLQTPNYKAKIERAFVLSAPAFDWCCPQYITERLTIEEIKAINQPLYEQIEKLEAEIKRHKVERNV
jgi:ABC-type Zn uptake system ZnuABC Zn-binding protein ZnuA